MTELRSTTRCYVKKLLKMAFDPLYLLPIFFFSIYPTTVSIWMARQPWDTVLQNDIGICTRLAIQPCELPPDTKPVGCCCFSPTNDDNVGGIWLYCVEGTPSDAMRQTTFTLFKDSQDETFSS